jgi:hypothetical protein
MNANELPAESHTKKGTREMNDTITIAELRKTELYRKEQTRHLRELLEPKMALIY